MARLWFNDPVEGPMLMNLYDIDAAHALEVDPRLWSVEEPAARAAGPTVEEWVAAGYSAAAYPPSGYAAKSTPEEVAAAIAAASTQAAPAPAAAVRPVADPAAVKSPMPGVSL
jgi:hypothetical protein